MKKLFKKRSKLLFGVLALESIFTMWILFYFSYLDRMSYAESVANTTNELVLVVQNMYTSTWWALIIAVLSFICVFSLVCFIYRDLKSQFVSIILWIILLIISINFKDSFLNNFATILIFIPIFGANIFAYKNQKKLM